MEAGAVQRAAAGASYLAAAEGPEPHYRAPGPLGRARH